MIISNSCFRRGPLWCFFNSMMLLFILFLCPIRVTPSRFSPSSSSKLITCSISTKPLSTKLSVYWRILIWINHSSTDVTTPRLVCPPLLKREIKNIYFKIPEKTFFLWLRSVCYGSHPHTKETLPTRKRTVFSWCYLYGYFIGNNFSPIHICLYLRWSMGLVFPSNIRTCRQKTHPQPWSYYIA